MSHNLDLANSLLSALCNNNLRHFVICTGSFNSPVFAALSRNSAFIKYHHFEERSAAFYALGLSKSLGTPVAVCVTSGTAVAECLPAVIEAYYSGIPLLVISGDRESSLSGSGYPQAIEQASLLKSHCLECLDISTAEDLRILSLRPDGPSHINLRFSEPVLSASDNLNSEDLCLQRSVSTPTLKSSKLIKADQVLKDFKRPLAILDKFPSDKTDEIKNFLINSKIPVLAEARSGLREGPDLQPQILKSNDRLTEQAGFDLIIRIGAIPSFNLWRSLERVRSLQDIPVFSFSHTPKFSGLGRASHVFDILKTDFSAPLQGIATDWQKKLFDLDQCFTEKLEQVLGEFPESEAALVRYLSEQIPAESAIYLGNSLPIRQWNEFASFGTGQPNIDANRGANGIDGQLASFFGIMQGSGSHSNFCLLGDLTFLYDCNSLSLLPQLKDRHFCLAVINNKGGRIAERLPYFESLNKTAEQKSNFIFGHNLSCSEIAQAFGMKTERLYHAGQPLNISGQFMLEILPDEQQSRLLNNHLKHIISELLQHD